MRRMVSRHQLSSLCTALLIAAALMLLAPRTATTLPPSGTSCYAITTIAIVCTQWNCESTWYVDDYWCSRTPGTDTVPNPENRNPSDAADQNLVIDNHRDVLQTNNPCAWEFDANDGLGSNFGGPNTQRPGHNGIDIQANLGDPVGVVRHGRITAIGWQNPNDHNAGCGYRIVVSHFNGDQSLYCHLKANSEDYSVNQFVRAGTVIAYANSTGNSSGNHLHLIYRKNGTDEIEYWDEAGTQPTPTELNGSC